MAYLAYSANRSLFLATSPMAAYSFAMEVTMSSSISYDGIWKVLYGASNGLNSKLRTESSSSPLSVHPRGLVQPDTFSFLELRSASLPITVKSRSPLSALVGPSDSSYCRRVTSC